MIASESALKTVAFYVNGKWTNAEGRPVMPVTNPANGAEIAQVAYASDADVNRTVELAHAAFLKWRDVPVVEDVPGASARADGATARAEGVDARLTRLWASRNARTVVNVLPVQFGFDQSALDDTAKSVLFALVRELRESPELSLELEGYTDAKGSHQYNVRLSLRRVEAVRRYLIEQGVERHRIRASARGPSGDAADPEGRKRRVDVKLVVASD